MNKNQNLYVYHPRYGRGYILGITEDHFYVRFRLFRRVYFPITAFDDKTLTACEETVKQFKARHSALLEWGESERSRMLSEA